MQNQRLGGAYGGKAVKSAECCNVPFNITMASYLIFVPRFSLETCVAGCRLPWLSLSAGHALRTGMWCLWSGSAQDSTSRSAANGQARSTTIGLSDCPFSTFMLTEREVCLLEMTTL